MSEWVKEYIHSTNGEINMLPKVLLEMLHLTFLEFI